MIDWSRVEELVSEIGAEDFGEVVELFLEEVDTAVSDLLAKQDPRAVQQTLHLIKGCAWNLGFDELGRLCAGQEQAIGADSNESIADLAQVYAQSRAAFLEGLAARQIAAPAA